MLIAPIALTAAIPVAFEDLAEMDARIAVIGAASPVDRRLKLARCPAPAELTQTSANAVAVRCPALGWRILVPLVAPAQSQQAPEIRKGDVVELSVAGTGFSVSTMATALEDGRIGRSLRVRTSDANAPISVSVTGPGRVLSNSVN